MNISPFYELRKRLYSSAAAGCSAVNEDFRLKKAADDFAEYIKEMAPPEASWFQKRFVAGLIASITHTTETKKKPCPVFPAQDMVSALLYDLF